jgi:hypothetical protein
MNQQITNFSSIKIASSLETFVVKVKDLILRKMIKKVLEKNVLKKSIKINV